MSFYAARRMSDDVYALNGKLPARWKPFLDRVDREQGRWVKVDSMVE